MMSDKVTVESLRAEALAWHATAERLRLVLVKIWGYAQPEFGMDDRDVRACIAQVAGRELGNITTEKEEITTEAQRHGEELSKKRGEEEMSQDLVERFYSDVEG